MKHVYIGTSGYNYKDWKNRFYVDVPQKDWLMYYSLFFNTVEVNATFYRSFPKSVFEKWHDITADDFTFTIKGPRLITHYQKLHNVEDNLKRFFDSISGLQDKLAIVLWQFPAQYKYTEQTQKNLINFLALLKNKPIQYCHFERNDSGVEATGNCPSAFGESLRKPTSRTPPSLGLLTNSDVKRSLYSSFLLGRDDSFRNVVELRDTSWFTDDVYHLLNEYHVGWVINDTSAFPSKEVITGHIAYIRFHGPTQLYASSYSDKQLNLWAQKIREYRKKVDTYCYFNNDVSGYAIENARRLKELL